MPPKVLGSWTILYYFLGSILLHRYSQDTTRSYLRFLDDNLEIMKYSLFQLQFIVDLIPLATAVAFPGHTPPPVSPNQKVFAASDFKGPKCQHGENMAKEKRAFGHDIVTCAIIPLAEGKVASTNSYFLHFSGRKVIWVFTDGTFYLSSSAQKLSPTAGITTPIPVGCTSGICGFSGNFVGCIHYSTQAIISKCIDYTSGAFPCGTRGDGCGDATYVWYV